MESNDKKLGADSFVNKVAKISLSMIAILMVILASSGSAYGKSTRQERRLINSGNTLYKDGKYAEAIQKYRAAIQENSSSDVAKFNLGLSRVRMAMAGGNDSISKALMAEGVKDLSDVAAIGDKKAELSSMANYNLGNLRFDQEDYAGAIQLYKQALRLNPSFTDARRNLRIAQLRQQKQQDDNKEDNKDQNKDKNQDQQQNQDQQKQDENKEQEQQEQQNQQQEPQPAENEISQQAASQILNAVENNEAATRARKGSNQGKEASGSPTTMRKW